MVDPELLTIGTKVKLVDYFPRPWKALQGAVVTISSGAEYRAGGKSCYHIEEDPMLLLFPEDMDCIVEKCEPISIDISSVL